MDHITEQTIVDLIGGDEIAGAQEHLASCARCRELHRRWIERMELLRDLHRETLDEAELHRLRVMYRQLGPQPVEGVRWVARLVRGSAMQPAAVRGVVSGGIAEYEAGPYTLLVQVGPAGRGSTVSVHGQLTTTRGDAGSGGTMALSSTDSGAHVCDIDRFGEFHLKSVAPGRYRALLWVDGGAIELVDLSIGGDETQ
jgi:hypothetical protein